MKRFSSLLLILIVGCSASSPTSNKEHPSSSPASSEATMAVTTGKPSLDETKESIRDFFTDPCMGVCYSKVEIQSISEPIQAPAALIQDNSQAWGCSVTMTCASILGDQIINKNWIILIGRENGKAKVKDYYNNLMRLTSSPAGKEWVAQNKFSEPTIE